jgi:GDP-L-fucose synthase
MNKTDKIYVAGHKGLVGSAIVRRLRDCGYQNIVGEDHKNLDLTNQQAVRTYFAKVRPDYVFLAAAKVGGIYANKTYPAEFIYSNLQIQMNIIDAAKEFNVSKLCFLGSSCIYPKYAQQPIREDYLLSGYLEETNEAYAIAKIAGIKMCHAYNTQYGTNFISVMPTNLYGPGDNYHPENSHVLPALIRRFHCAKLQQSKDVIIWGTGKALREFLYVDDLADACIFLMETYNDSSIVNIGSGEEISIAQLANCIKMVVGYEGEISYDDKKPDGTPRKLLDSNKIMNMGWKPKWSLAQGLIKTYEDYRIQHEDIRFS